MPAGGPIASVNGVPAALHCVGLVRKRPPRQSYQEAGSRKTLRLDSFPKPLIFVPRAKITILEIPCWETVISKYVDSVIHGNGHGSTKYGGEAWVDRTTIRTSGIASGFASPTEVSHHERGRMKVSEPLAGFRGLLEVLDW